MPAAEQERYKQLAVADVERYKKEADATGSISFALGVRYNHSGYAKTTVIVSLMPLMLGLMPFLLPLQGDPRRCLIASRGQSCEELIAEDKCARAPKAWSCTDCAFENQTARLVAMWADEHTVRECATVDPMMLTFFFLPLWLLFGTLLALEASEIQFSNIGLKAAKSGLPGVFGFAGTVKQKALIFLGSQGSLLLLLAVIFPALSGEGIGADQGTETHPQCDVTECGADHGGVLQSSGWGGALTYIAVLVVCMVWPLLVVISRLIWQTTKMGQAMDHEKEQQQEDEAYKHSHDVHGVVDALHLHAPPEPPATDGTLTTAVATEADKTAQQPLAGQQTSTSIEFHSFLTANRLKTWRKEAKYGKRARIAMFRGFAFFMAGFVLVVGNWVWCVIWFGKFPVGDLVELIVWKQVRKRREKMPGSSTCHNMISLYRIICRRNWGD